MTDTSLPQLEMIRVHLGDLPAVSTPYGYTLRTYRPGDDQGWCDIMKGNIGTGWTEERFQNQLSGDPRFSPDNLFFVVANDGIPVASACAWSKSGSDGSTGEVHMVAALESHRGKGLGHILNAAVLNRLAELGYARAHLLTDDWRVPAIRSYLTAGFRPEHTHESHPGRWETVLQSIEQGVRNPPETPSAP